MLFSVNGERLHGTNAERSHRQNSGSRKEPRQSCRYNASATAEPMELELVRDHITDETVVDAQVGPEGIGYVGITKFAFGTPAEFAEKLA